MIKGQKVANGPIGIDVVEGKNYAWCSCGLSKNQPFCDNSHKGSEFKPVIYKAKETKKFFFVLVNKLMINHSVMDHTISNKERKVRNVNKYFRFIRKNTYLINLFIKWDK